MNNWEKVTLGEVCDTNKYSYSSKDSWSYINYLDTGSITENKVVEIMSLFVGIDKVPSRAKRKVFTDDIIYSTVRPIQKHYGIIKNPVENMLVSTGFTTITVNNCIADPYYIYYFLTQNQIIESLQSIAEQSVSTYPSIKPSDLESLEINLPPLDEQKRIADALSALDDKIEINNKINENLEAQAQAIFKRWFVDFEFPDKEGKPYKTNGGKFIDSELGEIPVGWKVDSANNIFDISIGKTPPRKEPNWFSKDKMDVVWVSIADMGREGVYISNSSEYLTREAIKKFNVVVVPENTVLLSFKLTVGRISITDGKATTNEAIAHFKTENKTFTNYIYQYLKVYDYQSMGNTSSIATAVNSKIIKVMKIILPSDNLLKDFYNIVNPIMMSIKRNEQENKTLSELRDSLLIKLMSGEVRV